MSKRKIEFFVVDILIAINKVKLYTKDAQNAEEFLHDEKSFDATMRELEIVGEASKHLLHNNILDKEWQIVVDFRNIIIHEYFGVDIDEIWEVVTSHLIEFEVEILKVINKVNMGILNQVISGALIDFKYSKTTTKYLQTLQKELLKSVTRNSQNSTN